MEIIAESIYKQFSEKRVLRDISFRVASGESIAIVGHNGAGKTTLMRVLCGLIRQTSGTLTYLDDGKEIEREKIYRHLGLVGPYLELYEDLTARENISFFSKMRNLPDSEQRMNELMALVNLSGREDEPIKTFSSGMRQRMKYVFALLAKPEVLMLDEPTSNLDREGTETVYRIMEEQKKAGILIIATNDEEDLKYGDRQVAVAS